MTVILAALLFGGVPAGLAAYLQADAKGWRFIVGFALALFAGLALVVWSAWANHLDVRSLDQDPRSIAGGLLVGVMFLSLVGAIIGKVFSQRVDPVSLGLRTAVIVSVVSGLSSMTGVLG
jgi:phage shock protein PspC (stress-responsive transcriptional regulator)